jgi:hypothetical protein
MRGSAVQLPHKVPAGTRGVERDSAAWGGIADSLYECGVGGSGFAGQAGIGRRFQYQAESGRILAIASVRLATPSLANVFSRCLRTVPGESPSWRAIARLW